MASVKPIEPLEQRLGPGMDRRIERPRPGVWPVALVVLATALAGWAVYAFLQDAGVRSLTVDPARLTIATVRPGTFAEYVPVRGSVTPLRTVYLDAVEGGRVEQRFVEEGSLVVQDQPIVELSNTALQLDVISREAQVSEQLNNLRNTRLAMEQNRLALASELVEIDYQIKRLSRLAERRKSLADRGLISRQDTDETLDELEYYRRRRAVTVESQDQDERMRLAQIESLETSVRQLERNLGIAGQNLDNLVIKAPMGGRLTALDAELGASKARGERLGQIDDVDDFKVTAWVDEFYVTRLYQGQPATFSLAGREYRLQVDKVYPEVREGRFQADLTFQGDKPGNVPDNVRRGQTLNLNIALSDPEPALLLPTGGFFRDTGGHWAFVLNAAGTLAERRPIELGRRGPDHFEVLSGLTAGERVITSEYSAYVDMDRIELDN